MPRNEPHPLLARMSKKIGELEVAERRAHEEFLGTSPADGEEYDEAHTNYANAHAAADRARKDFHTTWRLVTATQGDGAEGTQEGIERRG